MLTNLLAEKLKHEQAVAALESDMADSVPAMRLSEFPLHELSSRAPSVFAATVHMLSLGSLAAFGITCLRFLQAFWNLAQGERRLALMVLRARDALVQRLEGARYSLIGSEGDASLNLPHTKLQSLAFKSYRTTKHQSTAYHLAVEGHTQDAALSE